MHNGVSTMANASAATQSLVISNNIVFNNLIKAVRTGKPVRCRIAKTRSVTIQTSCMEDSNLTEFDLAVLSCLHGIYQDPENPDNEFTVTGLCRMLGCTDKGGVSSVMFSEIETALVKLKSLQISVTDVNNDFESHRKAFLNTHPECSAHGSWDQITGTHWAAQNPLIQLKKRIINRSGDQGARKEVRYRIIGTPLLHTYSNVTGQFVTIPAEWFRIFDTDDTGTLTENRESMTKNRIAVTFRLARQLQRAEYSSRHPKKKQSSDGSCKLRLSTIMDRAGIDRRTASRHKGTHLAFIRKVLTCWKALGILPDWEIRESRIGRDVIIFHPEAPPAPAQNTAPDGSGNAPEIDTIFGVLDTIIGALDTIFGALKKPGFTARMAVQSGLQAIKDAAAELRKYSKYSTHDGPPALKAAGTWWSR